MTTIPKPRSWLGFISFHNGESGGPLPILKICGRDNVARIAHEDEAEGVPKDDFRTNVFDEATDGIRNRGSFDARMIARGSSSASAIRSSPRREEATLRGGQS